MTAKKPIDIHFQEDLERRVLHGLAHEWENALWVLSEEDRKQMRPPLFSLRSLKTRLGYWSPDRNEIVISRSFVMQYPWDDVRDVLLHEMAHQYADQILRSTQTRSHGSDFLNACERLRANPRASGNYKPLHERMNDPSLSEQDRILLRVKKLMSLAKSKNRPEAEAAMAKAHELMHKYNLDLLQHSPKRNFVSLFIGKPALRHHREEYHLANLLQSYYFVQGLWVSSYVLTKGKMGRVFEISGTIENVKIASYVYDFVHATINRNWRLYNKQGKLNRYRKTDFAVGVVEGFSKKLAAQKPETVPTEKSTALISLEDPLLKTYMAHKYPHTRSFQRRASSQDDQILNDGYAIGKKLVLSKGVESRKQSQKLLT